MNDGLINRRVLGTGLVSLLGVTMTCHNLDLIHDCANNLLHKIAEKKATSFETEEEAMAYMVEKAKEMGISDKKIRLELSNETKTVDSFLGGSIYKGESKSYRRRFLWFYIGDFEYGITLYNGHHNSTILDHELFHIADGHLDDGTYNFFIDEYWEEPRALLFSVFGKPVPKSLKEKN